MTLLFKNLHSAIDQFFDGKKESEKIIIFLLPFVIFSYLSYQFLTPMSKKYIAKKAEERKTLEAKLAETKEQLKNKHLIIDTVKNIEAQIKSTDAKLKAKSAENEDLTAKIAAMDFIRLNEENALIFTDYLAAEAVKNSISIKNMEANISSKERGVFKKEMSVDINCSGAFTSTLSFINAIESSKMFSKIESLRVIGGNRELDTSISLKVNGL